MRIHRRRGGASQLDHSLHGAQQAHREAHRAESAEAHAARGLGAEALKCVRGRHGVPVPRVEDAALAPGLQGPRRAPQREHARRPPGSLLSGRRVRVRALPGEAEPHQSGGCEDEECPARAAADGGDEVQGHAGHGDGRDDRHGRARGRRRIRRGRRAAELGGRAPERPLDERQLEEHAEAHAQAREEREGVPRAVVVEDVGHAGLPEGGVPRGSDREKENAREREAAGDGPREGRQAAAALGAHLREEAGRVVVRQVGVADEGHEERDARRAWRREGREASPVR
mmetsp:Transcript_25014/g.83845  ORF Transcript_25014/g.83845 Transcript_25014/m.83845 type:complete len:285 (+) Transcript_25014:719-1573(+)